MICLDVTQEAQADLSLTGSPALFRSEAGYEVVCVSEERGGGEFTPQFCLLCSKSIGSLLQAQHSPLERIHRCPPTDVGLRNPTQALLVSV